MHGCCTSEFIPEKLRHVGSVEYSETLVYVSKCSYMRKDRIYACVCCLRYYQISWQCEFVLV